MQSECIPSLGTSCILAIIMFLSPGWRLVKGQWAGIMGTTWEVFMSLPRRLKNSKQGTLSFSRVSALEKQKTGAISSYKMTHIFGDCKLILECSHCPTYSWLGSVYTLMRLWSTDRLNEIDWLADIWLQYLSAAAKSCILYTRMRKALSWSPIFP